MGSRGGFPRTRPRVEHNGGNSKSSLGWLRCGQAHRPPQGPSSSRRLFLFLLQLPHPGGFLSGLGSVCLCSSHGPSQCFPPSRPHLFSFLLDVSWTAHTVHPWLQDLASKATLMTTPREPEGRESPWRAFPPGTEILPLLS